MASFGAAYPIFAPHSETQTDSGLPDYDAIVVLGGLITANMTITTATGELYADNVLAEYVSEFASASIALETDDIIDAVAEVVYGATVETGQVHFKAGDSAPVGGFAYYKSLMRNRRKFFKGYYYPQVQAAMGNDNAQTKGSSVTFGTTATTLSVSAWQPTGDWRITKEFDADSEAAVRAWCREQLGDSGGTP